MSRTVVVAHCCQLPVGVIGIGGSQFARDLLLDYTVVGVVGSIGYLTKSVGLAVEVAGRIVDKSAGACAGIHEFRLPATIVIFETGGNASRRYNGRRLPIWPQVVGDRPRRITAEMNNRGYVINHKTIIKLMKTCGIKCRVRLCKYRSYRGETGKIAPNLLERNFIADKPNQKWGTYLTEFPLFGKKLYLFPIMDLYNREIISYNISDRPTFYQTM